MSLWIGRNLFLRRQPNFFFPNHQFSRFNSTIKYTTNPKLRNVAIIAHVDHGKTTLVDCLLKQAGAIEHNHSETRVMDSNKLEQERGITILSKVTSLKWGDTHVNIVDTPGHGDFGGEVERVLSMVDGVVLLVDATEGPMTQTKYVLSKALQTKLRPLVVINKMDRPSSRPQEVETEVFDLFSSLEANDEQLNYPTIYASAKAGWAKTSYEDESLDMSALLQTIVRHVPPPTVVDTDVFKLLVTSIETEPFTGRILTGRAASGVAKAGMKVYAFDQAGLLIEEGVITKVLSKVGVTRTILDEGMPGDLLSIAGLSKATVNMTISSSPTDTPIPAPTIDPPVLSVSITVNDSPLAGKEGTNLNPTAITERLFKEATHNVSLTVQRSEVDKALEVSGRGELHLGILIENLRREGFEINISQPRIIFKEENGKKLEPQEELVIDVEDQFSGLIMERMVARKAEMIDVRPYGGKMRIRYLCVSRALLGLKPILDNETRGSTQLHHTFHSYVPHKGPLSATGKGSIISMTTGKTTTYALDSVQERGVLFVGPNTPVYEGMIIGENAKPGDLDVNPCKEKALSNVRAAGKDETIKLAIPKVITLEEAICRIQDDELIEVTPKSIRLRKKILSQRVRQSTNKKSK